MRTIDRPSLIRWITFSLGMTLLALTCVASLLLLYGGGSWQSAARLEASSLASLEVSELIGTDHYHLVHPRMHSNLLARFVNMLNIPLVNPVKMLAAELPATQISYTAGSPSQVSLVQSLSHWANASRKIALGWIPYESADQTINEIKHNPGITVISPKWLSVKSGSGQVVNRIEPAVIKYAHDHKIKVWALVDNQFSAKLTHEVLSNPSHRKLLVENLLKLARTSGLDGINVDFENVKSADQTNFTAFVRELHAAFSPLHMTVSVDITPDIVFLHDDAAFFHAGLSAVSDYVIVMAYDEHWGGDQTPGPVADIPWVTSAVYDLLDTGVPANKLILGIPFYTRFWHVHSDGSVSSVAVKAGDVSHILSLHHATARWLPQLGVSYAKYRKSEGYEEVWYETDATLAKKLSLINENGLAGVAIWSLNLSDQHTWSTIVQALRQSLS